MGVEFNKDVGDNDAKKLISGSKLHLNLSEDTLYSQRLKRIPASSQKIILNNK